MLQSVAPLSNSFKINHFYWMKITSEGPLGYISTLGSHTEWHEWLYENSELMVNAPHIRHPENLNTEVILFHANDNPGMKAMLDAAWNKFKVNLTINIQKKIPGGIESFGFGVASNHVKATQHLINHLPLLQQFTDYFSTENQKLMRLSSEFQVEISSLLGPKFYETPQRYPEGTLTPLLEKLGLQAVESLTKRETEVMQFLAHGFPAGYIAEQLYLSTRTVQNHFENLKMKLNCKTKVCLIKKARNLQFSLLPQVR